MECPNCHDANKCGDYEGPTCDTCGGVGFVGIPSDEEFTERTQRLSPAQVDQWLRERAGNAVRLGRSKTDPKDQAGWFEDAMFFVAARSMVKLVERISH